jgi:dinuclear metal center YbgI/SA1388 family protein
MATPRLADVLAALSRRFPPDLAQDWDRVGLVAGDPDEPVASVLFAVDPAQPVAQEAVDRGAQLLVVHHPLLLRGVHSVAATSGQGRVVHTLVRAGCALFTMHTNADSAPDGTNDTLARLLGLTGAEPLVPADAELDTYVVYVPPDHRRALLDALFDAGAGSIGAYDRCGFWSPGTGQFRPGAAADPYLGRPGALEQVTEDRVEVVAPRALRRTILAALHAGHPYEEPAYSVVENRAVRRGSGIGRIGDLPQPLTLAAFADLVGQVLPPTAHGVRVAGDAGRPVQRVAICSGSGDSLLAQVRRSGADVYLTSDLRHHPVLDHLAEGGCPVVDVAHWAGEQPWLAGAAERLVADLAAQGATVEAAVSRVPTDPWSFRAGPAAGAMEEDA